MALARVAGSPRPVTPGHCGNAVVGQQLE